MLVVVLPELSRVPVPTVVVPSLNVTLPVGTTLPEAGLTVAVKVMLVPLVTVVAVAVSVVEVETEAGLITMETAEEVELRSPWSPA